MLLEAVLIQNKIKVFDEKSGKISALQCCTYIARTWPFQIAQEGLYRPSTRFAIRAALVREPEEDVLYLHIRSLVRRSTNFFIGHWGSI